MSSDEMEIQLELKDRLNYPELIQRGLLQLKKALAEPYINMSKIQSLILDLYTDIPDTWITQEDANALTHCFTIKTVDCRPSFAGEPLDLDYCKEQGIAVTREVKTVDYFKLKNWIINLLDKRHMLVRKQKIEMSTGRNLDVTLDDLEDEWDGEEEEPNKVNQDEWNYE